MSVRKTSRTARRQLGQWMTPHQLAREITAGVRLTKETRVLEPGFGDGSFVLSLIDAFMPLYEGSAQRRLAEILRRNVFGVEIDPDLRRRAMEAIATRWGDIPRENHLYQGDYLSFDFGRARFDLIIGNPPFGGTIDPERQDEFDTQFGMRGSQKIKKESYAFFVVRSVDLLAPRGNLVFICSDTFLTINTMRGLRRFLMSVGTPHVTHLTSFSDETNHPVVVLELHRTGWSDQMTLDRSQLMRSTIEITPNFSWGVTSELAKYFSGVAIGDFMVASGGMTTGRNEYFVREIRGGRILEPYRFEFFNDPVTLDKAVAKARLGRLTVRERARVLEAQAAGKTVRNVRVIPQTNPDLVSLPDSRYARYNKASSSLIYAQPSHAIFWADDGDAVLTYKRNGDWYLRGVGGQSFFGRQGITWPLVASRLNARYLPPGYILDSGSPAAFLREGVDPDELWFILGWAVTSMASRLLKQVINHTRNIQGKDFERLPYPWWVKPAQKIEAIGIVRELLAEAMRGRVIARSDSEIRRLEEICDFHGEARDVAVRSRTPTRVSTSAAVSRPAEIAPSA